MKRIFIAINLPKEIKLELEKLEKEINDLFPSELNREMIRWLKKDNLHITLLFIGWVKEEEIIQTCQIAKKVAQNKKNFSLRFKKVCYGPPKKIPPRLIWIELEKKPELLELAEELKKETAKAGILRKIEKREFSPHITLARIKTWQWRKIEPEERPEIEREISLDFEVNSIEIMESKLKKSGAEYNIIESIPFP